MDFGKVTSEEVKNINFSLANDGRQTIKVLNGDAGVADVYVGCPNWGMPAWVDYLYPPKTKAATYLNEYAKHFNAVELNAAYYKIPSIETARKWRTQASDNAKEEFLFCPKFPDSISHQKRLVGVEQITDEFLSSVTQFQENLGPCFLQLSDSFGPNNIHALEAFLKSLPHDLTVFTELRNAEWFAKPDIRDQIFDLFTRLNKGTVITDVSGRRDVLNMEVTNRETFIRFVGNGKAHRKADYARIDVWAGRLKQWQEKGLRKIYFFFHQPEERESVLLAMHAIQSFNKTLGSQIPEIKLSPSLFI
jgi:uncharacterized protein YecE (DUF72 family)